MELIDGIRQRRSIRRFTSQEVEAWKLDEALDAARWAPSSKNSQPWEFIVIRHRETLSSVAGVTTYAKFLADAPLAVAFVTDPSKSNWHEVDGALAAQNFALAAWRLGLGTCWTGTMERESAKSILGIPPEKNLLTVMPLGYPAEQGQSKRNELDVLVHQEHYGGVTGSSL